MIKETVVINVDTKEAVDNVDDLNKSIKKTGKVSEETKSTLDTITGGAASKFTKLIGTIGGVVKSFKTLRVAIIASGVGALALAVLAVGKAFTSSEEGQNKFAKLMGVIGVVTGNLMDVVADVGESIIKVFTEPKQVLIDFGESIKKWITGQIELALETVSLLGSAFKKIFKGDFSGALEDAGKATKKFLIDANPMIQFYKSVGKASADFVKQTSEEVKSAQKVADARAKADKVERKLVVRRAELENKIAQLRLKSREEDKFSAAERKKALLDAQVLEDELLVKEKEVLKLRSDAIQLENTFSRSTKENLNAEAEAKAALLRQEAARTNQQRQTQRELNRLNKEIQADENRALKEKEDSEKEFAKFKEDLRKEEKDKVAQTEVEKNEAEKNKRLNELEELKLSEAQKRQAIIDVNAYYDELEKEAREKDAENAEENKKKENAAIKALNDKKLNDEIAQTKAEEDNRQKQYAVVGNAIGNLQNIFAAFGKESKALAIAGIVTEQVASISKIISNTGIANAKAVAASPLTFGQPFVGINSVSAGLSIAGSVAGAVKAISDLKSNKKSPSSASASSGVRSAAPRAPQAASFNLVGQGGTNQLAEAIGSQSQQPVRAYVVSNDVTTAQSLDRNIVESASL